MRIVWIDELKGIAIILVVLGHVIGGYLHYTDNAFLCTLSNGIYKFHMPLFFMISGYLYQIKWKEQLESKQINREVLKRFGELGSVYMLFSFLWWLPKYVIGFYTQIKAPFSIYDLLAFPIKPIEHLWFLWVLVLLFVFVPILEKYFKQLYLLVVFGGLYLCSPWIFSVIDNTIPLSAICYGGVYFLLGGWLRKIRFENIIIKRRKNVACISFIICVLDMWNTSQYWGRAISIGVAVAASYLIWFSLQQWNMQMHKYIHKILCLCGEKSLSIYLLHMYILIAVRKVLDKGNPDLYTGELWGPVIIGTCLGVIIPLWISYVDNISRFLFHPLNLFREHHN